MLSGRCECRFLIMGLGRCKSRTLRSFAYKTQLNFLAFFGGIAIIIVEVIMGLFKRKLYDENGKLIKRKGLKLGIAFGGGALRGIGHIGVIRALEELGIEADYVAGTSAGSMVGALYCAGFKAADMERELKKLKVSDIRNSKLFWIPSDSENIEEVLNKIFGKELVFSELKTPLTIVAVDIVEGEQVNITSGSVAKASSGSCAVPGVFKPVIYDQMHLVDGGVLDNVPADVVRNMGADVVIAVEVNHTRGDGTPSLKLKEILNMSLGILMQANVEKTVRFADIVLKPELKDFSSTKVGNVDAMIEAGYKAVMDNKDEIIKLLTKPSLRRKRKFLKLSKKIDKFD